MQYEFAPLEAITGYIYRNAHHACFPSMDRYYTPFITPKKGKSFTTREWNDIAAEHTQNLAGVPQILPNQAEGFCKVAGMRKEQGNKEVNLNLGCPSATVTAKKKGAGFLADPDALDAFLEEIFAHSPLKISIKTRIGVENPDEFERLLDIFSQYPIQKLIVHPRVLKDFYSGGPRQELYGKTLECAPFPVAYNGDIFTLGDFNTLVAAYPQTRHVMLGRGIVANPALARMIRGGEGLTREELERFHNELYRAYTDDMGGNAAVRMKEWWSYAEHAFADPPSVHRIMRKTRLRRAFPK